MSPDVVDSIVFWTKNPLPLMSRLEELRAYPFYFQFTLTPYGKDVEPGVPSKNDVILPAFQELSRRIGPERVIWRYDPILFTDRYTIDYHITFFSQLAQRLEGYTRKCIISFVDLYRNTQSNMNGLGFAPLTEKEIMELAQRLDDIAGEHHLVLETCAEQIDLSPYGIAHGHCIDRTLLEQIAGCRLSLEKDKNQRPRMRLHGKHRHWYVRHLPPRMPVLLCYAQPENCCAQYASPRSELAAALRADPAGGRGEGTGGKVLQGGATSVLLIHK